jgi:hypothetical protein
MRPCSVVCTMRTEMLSISVADYWQCVAEAKEIKARQVDVVKKIPILQKVDNETISKIAEAFEW